MKIRYCLLKAQLLICRSLSASRQCWSVLSGGHTNKHWCDSWKLVVAAVLLQQISEKVAQRLALWSIIRTQECYAPTFDHNFNFYMNGSLSSRVALKEDDDRFKFGSHEVSLSLWPKGSHTRALILTAGNTKDNMSDSFVLGWFLTLSLSLRPKGSNSDSNKHCRWS